MKKLLNFRKRTPVVRLILHVGPPKTGSTVIQNALHRNREALMLHGVFVPLNESELGQHGSILRQFKTEYDSAWDTANLTLDDIYSGMSNSGCDTLVLSSEHFLGLRSARGVERLISAIAPRQLQIVAGIRPAMEVAASSFSQMLKVYHIPEGRPPETFIDSFRMNLEPRWTREGVASSFTRWRSMVPGATLDVLAFGSGGDVLGLFVEATGLPLLDTENLYANERISACLTRANWDMGRYIKRLYPTMEDQKRVIDFAADPLINGPVPSHECGCAQDVSPDDSREVRAKFDVFREALFSEATRVWGDVSALDGKRSEAITIPRPPDAESHDLVLKILITRLSKTSHIFRDMAEGNEFWQETSRKHEQAAEYWRRQYEELAGR